MNRRLLRGLVIGVLGITFVVSGETGKYIAQFPNNSAIDAIIKMYPSHNRVELFPLKTPAHIMRLDEFQKEFLNSLPEDQKHQLKPQLNIPEKKSF